MSELEILKRQEYKRNRKKWIMIQFVAIIVMAALALGMFLVHDRVTQTYYIEYTQNGDVDYLVHYKENDFFDEAWIERDQAYISALIDDISADFIYDLQMDASNAELYYNYRIDAKLSIADSKSNYEYYTVKENLRPMVSAVVKQSSGISIRENVHVDYVKFHEIATNFVKTYNLKNASSTLVVTLDVEVLSAGAGSEPENVNHYSVSLNVPVAVETFNTHISSSAPANESRVFAYSGLNSGRVFKILGIVAASLAVALVVTLLVFLHMTKNEDITYAAKIRKLLGAYSSYIQRMEGEFDTAGFHIIMIKTFNELLGIRDTIQAPILMSENTDETMTRFLIPTNTNVLYVFEIKVDNYDEIYSRVEGTTEMPM